MGLLTDIKSFQLEPEVYKTRKDENFTEYFKVHIHIHFLTKNQFILFVPGWKGQVLHKSGGGAALRFRVQGSPTARGQTGENIILI